MLNNRCDALALVSIGESWNGALNRCEYHDAGCFVYITAELAEFARSESHDITVEKKAFGMNAF